MGSKLIDSTIVGIGHRLIDNKHLVRLTRSMMAFGAPAPFSLGIALHTSRISSYLMSIMRTEHNRIIQGMFGIENLVAKDNFRRSLEIEKFFDDMIIFWMLGTQMGRNRYPTDSFELKGSSERIYDSSMNVPISSNLHQPRTPIAIHTK